MIPQSQPKKKKNSSRANLIISTIFHAILLGLLFYFAARSGILGKKVQTITTTLIHEKKPELPKPKPEPPKVEPPKIEPPKIEAPKMETAKAPPPAAAPVVAPPPADVPGFDFEGGKTVETSSDPVQLYKGYMEYTLRQKWNRPEDMADENYAAEVAVNVGRQGDIQQTQWVKGSGNAKWDQTVKDVFKAVSSLDRPPPTNFPASVIIRFDVQEEETEPVMTQ